MRMQPEKPVKSPEQIAEDRDLRRRLTESQIEANKRRGIPRPPKPPASPKPEKEPKPIEGVAVGYDMPSDTLRQSSRWGLSTLHNGSYDTGVESVGRIGLGFILPSLNLGAMRGVPHTLIPQGSSIINFIRMVGGATGVSLCAIVLEWRLSAHGAQLGEVASAAALRAFNETFACLAALTALALLAAWHLGRPERPAHKDE